MGALLRLARGASFIPSEKLIMHNPT
jgi:hypothetical protein